MYNENLTVIKKSPMRGDHYIAPLINPPLNITQGL